MSYTIKNLRNDLEFINKELVESLSPYFLVEQGRYNRQNVDVYVIDENGLKKCMNHLEGGSSKECADTAFAYLDSYRGYNFRYEKLTRAQAKGMLKVWGVDFEKDFHQSPLSCRQLLVDLTKATKYRAPKNANGSTARYFFQHLANKH